MIVVKDIKALEETCCTRIIFDFLAEYPNASSAEIDDFYSPDIYSDVVRDICQNRSLILQLFSFKVPANNVNRLADYKGVWGFLKMKKNKSDFSLDLDGYRIYYGLSEVEKIRFSRSSSTAFLLKSPSEMSILEQNLPLLLSGDKQKGMIQILSAAPSARLLDYEIGNDAITLTIWGKNA